MSKFCMRIMTTTPPDNDHAKATAIPRVFSGKRQPEKPECVHDGSPLKAAKSVKISFISTLKY